MSYPNAKLMNLEDGHTLLSVIDKRKADMIIVNDNTPAAVMSFHDGADGLPMALKVAVEPVQDLHGYDHPWPAGGGKNLLNITLVNGSHGNLTWEIQKDSASNITGVKFNGSHSDSSRYFPKIGDIYLEPGNYYLSGGINAYCSIDIEGGIGKENNSPSVPTPFTVSTAGTYPVYFAIFGNRTFNNDVAYPMIRLSSVSDATFAPYSNICPISGWTGAKVNKTGKNLYIGSPSFDGYGPDATELANWVVQSETYNGHEVRRKSGMYGGLYQPIKLKPGTYVFSVLAKTDSNSSASMNLHIDNGSETIAAQTFSLTNSWQKISKKFDISEECVIRARAYGSEGSGFLITEYQLENGESSADYEPFGETYAITFPSEAGTVYGGTLTVNKDGTGSLAVEKGYKNLVGASEELYTLDSYQRFAFSVPDYTAIAPDLIDNNIISNRLKSVKKDYVFQSDYAISGLYQGAHNMYIRINSSITTVELLKTWLANNNVQIVYNLTTPSSPIALTAPQVKALLGANNVWADTGDILSVDYPADTKLYIDGKIASLQALILENISNT